MVEELRVPESEIVKESAHCIHPSFIEHEIEHSLDKLNLQTLDLYYLQNPYEAQGPYNTDNVFFDRLSKAFECLESLVEKKKIMNYGIATYSSFRVKPSENKMHLSLEKVVQLTEKIGGKDHHMKYVQAPINILMPEAFVEPWQQVTDKAGVTRQKMLLAVAADLEINVISSQPLLQGFLADTPLSRQYI